MSDNDEAAKKAEKRKKWLWGIGMVIGSLILLGLPIVVTFNTSAAHQTVLGTAFLGVQAAGTVLAALALVAAFAQVREARKQLKENRNWNRMSFALTSLPQMEMLRAWELELDVPPVRLIQRDKPLSHAEVEQIFANSEIHLKLKMYLNALESYCVAVNWGLAHEEVAKDIWRGKLARHYLEMLPYITKTRTDARNDRIYKAIEDLHKKWSAERGPTSRPYGQD